MVVKVIENCVKRHSIIVGRIIEISDRNGYIYAQG